MSTTQNPETSPEMGEVVQLYNQHPHEEGVFGSKENGVYVDAVPTETGLAVMPLPAYETEVDIDATQVISNERHKGLGTTYLERWQMSDGIQYDIMFAEPEHRRTDIAVVKDTAWGTQVLGFNLDVARQLMALGFPVVIKGPEIGGSIPLSHSAHNTHKVLDTADIVGYHEPKVVAVEGYSRGAMIGFGTLAYAAQNNRKIIYANLTDPCLAHSIEATPQQAVDTVRNLDKTPSEIATAAFQIGRLLLNPMKAWHYRQTVNLSPEGLRQFYQTGKPLFTGEAGFLARHVPRDAQATLCFFLSSFANHEREFIEILKNHEGVEIKHSPGGHVAGMDRRILGNIASRFAGLSEQLSDGAQPGEIDYSHVHKATVSF